MSIILNFLVTLKLVIYMNKKTWIIVIIVIVILIIGAIFLFKNNTPSNNNNNTYEVNRTSTNSTFDNNIKKNENTTNTEENTNSENKSNEQQSETSQPPIEEEIATYSTKIYSQDSARQNNIAITCKTLNDTLVKKGATFSFCQTVGPATTNKGYEKAEIFDNKGKKKKGLGGGNCQISTTLYNAVLSVPSLTVTERHTHSNKVPYIAPGKDAAVAYGSYDLKFVNNLEGDIKIYSEASASAINIRLVILK